MSELTLRKSAERSLNGTRTIHNEAANVCQRLPTLEGTITLPALWVRHKHECRPLGAILKDARETGLPGVELAENGITFNVQDEPAALAAMRNVTSRDMKGHANG